jgi:hypothetical protein
VERPVKREAPGERIDATPTPPVLTLPAEKSDLVETVRRKIRKHAVRLG